MICSILTSLGSMGAKMTHLSAQLYTTKIAHLLMVSGHIFRLNELIRIIEDTAINIFMLFTVNFYNYIGKDGHSMSKGMCTCLATTQ